MARFKDREQAITLRKKGHSYSQIKKTLQVSKSTLSYWLRDYPLSEERIRELRDWNEQRIENFRGTMRRKREDRLQRVYTTQKKEILPLKKRDVFIAGLLLYLGEGTKTRSADASLSNTDPAVIKLFIYWLLTAFQVPKEKLVIRLHLYQDMNTTKEIQYWVDALNIPRNQFRKPYIKQTTQDRINHKGRIGHGTCNIIARDVHLFEKIMMGMQVITDDVSRLYTKISTDKKSGA